MNIVAIGNQENGNGNISSDITSGEEGPGNINAFIIAGGYMEGDINAGDTYDFGSNAVGNFTGGVWAGAGLDLLMTTTADNSADGSIGDIYTAGDLNATLGIYAQDSIGTIEVGIGINGGNLLGNVVAQGDITDIEVWGNLGASGTTGLVFAGDNIGTMAVGNPDGYRDVAGHGSDVIAGTNTFGTVYDNVYIGGSSGTSTPAIYIGQGFAAGTTLIAGLDNGLGLACSNLIIEQFGHELTFNNEGVTGSRMVLELTGAAFDPSNPGVNMPNIWLYSNSGGDVGLDVYGDGAASEVGTVIAVNTLDSLNVFDGSVGQIIVDNNYDIAGAINGLVGASTPFGSLLASVPWATASLSSVKDIEYAVGSGVVASAGTISVEGNIGVQGVSIGSGLTGEAQPTPAVPGNAAIWVQGNLTGSVTSAEGSIGNIVVIGYISNEPVEITAFGSIGDIWVGQDTPGNTYGYGPCSFSIDSETDGIGVLSVSGDITSIANITADSIGGLVSRTGMIEVTPGPVIVVGSIGDITAYGDITGTYTSETGSIGNITSLVGTVDVTATAAVGIGNVTASGDITGTYIAQTGSIGNFSSDVGNIGSSECAIIIKANGGVQLDPYSLKYVNVVNGTVLDGVGTLYSALGNIYANITTGGSVGALASTVTEGGNPNQVIGGIAAPLGTVDVTLMVGGNVGGISGQEVSVTPGSVILGSIGILRNSDDVSDAVVQGVDANNPLIIQSMDSSNDIVDYMVEVSSGTANVTFSIYGGVVTFDSITYTVGSADDSVAGIQVVTATGDRSASGVPTGTSTVKTEVDDMVVDGSIANITVDGGLDNLTVNGNLAGGALNVQSLGYASVSGNIGTAAASGNPFASNETILIADGQFCSLTAGPDGRNFGIQTVTLTSGEYLTWANSLNDNPNVSNDAFITAYLGSGSAVLTINNGYLEDVAVAGGSASNLEVLASSTAYASATSTTPTKKGVSKANDSLFAAQASLISSGQSSKGKAPNILTNLLFQDRLVPSGEADVANVGTISALSGQALNLTNVIIGGDLGTLGVKGAVTNVTVGGDVSTLTGVTVKNVTIFEELDNLVATNGASNIVVRGDAYQVDGGTSINGLSVVGDLTNAKAINSITNVRVGGDLCGTITAGGTVNKVIVAGGYAGTINAGSIVENVNVLGDAGVISAGRLLQNIAVTGDMMSLNGGTMKNVAVEGSVGYEYDASGDAILGGSFTSSQVASLLGISLNGGSLWNAVTSGYSGEGGCNGIEDFIGGIEAVKVSGVSVGGEITNLMLTGTNSLAGGADGLLLDTIYDAFVTGPTIKGKPSAWIKDDGALIAWPGMPTASKGNGK